ncbi:MAG: ATP-binding cassette domain-containing protein [Deltaproteobacteria bacterium]|nr:ATP-binding cassette domain-containing protein [Deltaproteobacteria bacterium]
MGLVSIRDVTLAFGRPPLLDGVNMQIDPGERVCLVDERRHLVERVLSRMELDGAAPTETMSGGLKRRVLLARAMIRKPDLLLLDEPTNHLDIDSITWLEKLLLRFRGALMFITHDRAFLERLATRVVDLDRGQLTSWPGGYRNYLDDKQAALEVEQRQRDKFDKKLAQEEIWIRKGVRARRTRNEGRVRALEQLREEARSRRAPASTARIHMQAVGRTSKKIVEAQSVAFAYPAKGTLIEGLTTTVYRGDKIGVIGNNGCGKTTLLRLLLGELRPGAGEVRLGDNLEVAYLDQLRHTLDEDKTVAENVVEAGDNVIVDGAAKHVLTYLRDFLFTEDRARSPIWVLSGGERNRLLLAKLFTRPANVLVLDEPTNDLDTETLELLEAKLADFGGTVLLVSHDRAFLDNTVTSTLVFEDGGRIGEYAGGYSDWLEQRNPSDPDAASAKREPKPRRVKPAGPRRLTFGETHELEALPATIEALEAEQATLHTRLADPVFYRTAGGEVAAASERLETLEQELATAYARWEELEAIREASRK